MTTKLNKIIQIVNDEQGKDFILSFKLPRQANIQLVKELNEIKTVEVKGIICSVETAEDAEKARKLCTWYLQPHNREKVEQYFNKWKWLFQRPYETSSQEMDMRVEAMIDNFEDLPADCIRYIYNQSIKSFRILPPYADVYALVKTEYESRKHYLDFFENKVDELQ